MKKWLIFLFILATTGATFGQKVKVFHFKIGAEIDPRTNRISKIALDEAKKQNADIVILELNTYGGALNDADSIRQRILDFPKPVFVFINKNAASAGALISIACDSIYMTEGSNIGAATVVYETGEAAPDKYQSYMRSLMRSTAEATGRNPKIAEAMVDEDLVVDSVSEKGKVITFTVSEAIKYGFCDGKVEKVDDILTLNGIENYEITHFEPSATEKIINWFLNPAISGILIMFIVGGLYFELRTPGIGFPLVAAIIAGALYLLPYYINGLAANWEIALFAVGVILIGLEIFVIPGFGVVGISGILISFGALFLMMLNNDFFDFTFVLPSSAKGAAISILFSLFGTIAFVIAGGALFLKSKAMKKIAVMETMTKKHGYTSIYFDDSVIGKIGESYTVLRPSGKVKIEDKIYDAESRGEYVEKGVGIKVIGINTTTLIVKTV